MYAIILLQMYEREGDILSSYNNSFGTCIKPLTSFEIQQQ